MTDKREARSALAWLCDKASDIADGHEVFEREGIIRAHLEQKAEPVAGMIIPVEPHDSSRPLITNEMKAKNHGYHSFEMEQTCIECAVEGASEDCPECDGSGVYMAGIEVPWDTCKEIYKGMAKTACIGTTPPSTAEVEARALERFAIKMCRYARSAKLPPESKTYRNRAAGLAMCEAKRIREQSND